MQQTQIIPCCYYKPRKRSGDTGKETQILKEGARSDRCSPNHNESPIPEPSIVRFFGTRSCGDDNDQKFLFRFFENSQKRSGQLGFNKKFLSDKNVLASHSFVASHVHRRLLVCTVTLYNKNQIFGL